VAKLDPLAAQVIDVLKKKDARAWSVAKAIAPYTWEVFDHASNAADKPTPKPKKKRKAVSFAEQAEAARKRQADEEFKRAVADTKIHRLRRRD
jgi:hypothetical protein